MIGETDHAPADAQITIDGAPYRLRLTLGALAFLEEKLGDGDITALTKRLAKPSVNDLLVLLHALLQGGGAGLAFSALKAADIDLHDAASAVSRCFAAFGGSPLRDEPSLNEPKMGDPLTEETVPGKSQGHPPAAGEQGRSPLTSGSAAVSS